MNWIKKLFGLKEKQHNTQNVGDSNYSPLATHEKLLINKIIGLLESNPDFFSACWSKQISLDKSIRSKDNRILIMIETGEIIQPTEPNMSFQQKNRIKELIKPIVERDSKYIIENLIQKY